MRKLRVGDDVLLKKGDLQQEGYIMFGCGEDFFMVNTGGDSVRVHKSALTLKQEPSAPAPRVTVLEDE